VRVGIVAAAAAAVVRVARRGGRAGCAREREGAQWACGRGATETRQVRRCGSRARETRKRDCDASSVR
jgi:hypothetical protein